MANDDLLYGHPLQLSALAERIGVLNWRFLQYRARLGP